jgi:hypothetical protein
LKARGGFHKTTSKMVWAIAISKKFKGVFLKVPMCRWDYISVLIKCEGFSYKTAEPSGWMWTINARSDGRGFTVTWRNGRAKIAPLLGPLWEQKNPSPSPRPAVVGCRGVGLAVPTREKLRVLVVSLCPVYRLHPSELRHPAPSPSPPSPRHLRRPHLGISRYARFFLPISSSSLGF